MICYQVIILSSLLNIWLPLRIPSSNTPLFLPLYDDSGHQLLISKYLQDCKDQTDIPTFYLSYQTDVSDDVCDSDFDIVFFYTLPNTKNNSFIVDTQCTNIQNWNNFKWRYPNG